MTWLNWVQFLIPFTYSFFAYSLFLIPYSLFLIPYFIFLIPYYFFPIPFSLFLILYSLFLFDYSLFLNPYYFKLLWPQCYSLHLLCGRWWKTPSTTFHRSWVVRPSPHVKYTSMVYPYIPGCYNYSSHSTTYLLTNIRSWSGIILSGTCAEVIIIRVCYEHSLSACNTPLHD